MRRVQVQFLREIVPVLAVRSIPQKAFRFHEEIKELSTTNISMDLLAEIFPQKAAVNEN